jgi:dynein heavy chain
MMSALRMVWIISRYYSDDACMGSLMERIAYQIAERVSQETDFRNLVKRPASEATRLISTSKSVLDSWSDVYLQVREKIEVSGRDPR